jgi:hypothetical protein
LHRHAAERGALDDEIDALTQAHGHNFEWAVRASPQRWN